MNKKWKMTALMGLATTGMMASAVSAEGSYKIGICQLTQHEALEEATKGFQDYVSEKLGDQVTFDVQKCIRRIVELCDGNQCICFRRCGSDTGEFYTGTAGSGICNG